MSDPQYDDAMPPMGAEQPQPGQGDLSAYAYNNATQGQSDNLVVFQLELNEILDKIEHLLKGDILQKDAEGNYDYVEPADESLMVLNNFGVQLVMQQISMYLNRNTILSNYKEDRIFEILYDLGNELADLIYINYEKMGLNTVEKRSRYPILVYSILCMIESSYNRALGGNELESLRSARVVTQNQPLGTGNNVQAQPGRRGFSIFHPFGRWNL